MDNLINYGSDDDNADSDNSSKYHQGTVGSNRVALHGGGGDYKRLPSQRDGGGDGNETTRTGDDGTNYDHIQMDLSEEDEPAKHAITSKSAESNADRPQHRDNSRHGNGNKQRDTNSRTIVPRDREQRDKDKNHRGEDRTGARGSREDRDRSSNRAARDSRRNGRNSGTRKASDRDRESTRRDSADNRRERDSGGNRDRDNSSRRDRDNNSRDNYSRQSDNRRRSPVNHSSNSYRGGGAAARRFDRASNKMAQLEKLGIEIKAPENFVPPASGIYTPDDARGNNGPYQLEGGGGDGQFFMPGVQGRFRDQIERRKQLWAKSKQPDTPAPNHPTTPTQRTTAPITQNPLEHPSIAGGRSTWAATTFAQDTDGRQASKFKRLMGIRGESGAASSATTEGATNQRQEEMFNSMEAQYEVARTATHTMRGVGLGFSSAVQGLYQK